MAHIRAHGPAVGSLADGIVFEPGRWTIRCPRCGRQTYTAEQMDAAPCTAAT